MAPQPRSGRGEPVVIEQGYPGSDSGRPPGGLSLKRIALISAYAWWGRHWCWAYTGPSSMRSSDRGTRRAKAVAVAFASAVATRDARGLRLLVDPSLVSTDDEGVTMVDRGRGRHGVPIETLAVGRSRRSRGAYPLRPEPPSGHRALASGDGTMRLTAPSMVTGGSCLLMKKGGAMSGAARTRRARLWRGCGTRGRALSGQARESARNP